MKRFINSGMFGVAVLCFFLPFMNIKCNGAKLLTVSGFEMATGTNLAPPTGGGMFDSAARSSETDNTKKMFEIPLLLVLLTLLVGCIITLIITIKNRPIAKNLKVSLYLSITALVFMLLEAVSLFVQLKDLDTMGDSSLTRMLTWHFDVGYWLVTLISIGLIIYNAYLLKVLNKPGPEAMFDNYVEPQPPSETV